MKTDPLMYFMSSCFPVKSVQVAADFALPENKPFRAGFRALGGSPRFLTGRHEIRKYMKKRQGRRRGTENMKALPMLDHVMLWIARVFVALSLAATIYDSFFHNDSAIENFQMIGMVVLWFVCILQFKRLPCRLVLGISSLCLLLITLSLSHYGIPMVGLVAMFWTAIRAPHSQESVTASNPI